MPTSQEKDLFFWPLDKGLEELDKYNDTLRLQSRETGWGMRNFFATHQYPNFNVPSVDNVNDRPWVGVWQGLCELLFALRRPLENEDKWYGGGRGEGDIIFFTLEYWSQMDDKSGGYNNYRYYENPEKYGWVLYLDVDSLIAKGITSIHQGSTGLFNGEPVSRTDINSQIFKAEGPDSGASESQASLKGSASQPKPTTPIDIPEFPKWNDKIKDKFHRSVDKDMSGWDKSLDVWQTELQNALAN